MTRRSRTRQRGTVYLLVLVVTAMLVGIGVTAVMVGRIDLQGEALEEDQAQARQLARGGIEIVRKQLEGNSNWRTGHTHDGWSSSTPVGAGSYRYKLVDEEDGSLTDDGSDPVRLYVEATVGQAVRIYSMRLDVWGVLAIPIVVGSDDAEQDVSHDGVRTYDNDLQLCDVSVFGLSYVGLRFVGIDIPNSATVTAASIQFTSQLNESGNIDLTLRAQAADNAATFVQIDNNISSRATTSASVAWSPSTWYNGHAGVDQQSPDLAVLVQEVVDRSGWSSGNALAFVIEGTGRRTSYSFDGDAALAPVLHLEFMGGNQLRPDYTTLRRELAQ